MDLKGDLPILNHGTTPTEYVPPVKDGNSYALGREHHYFNHCQTTITQKPEGPGNFIHPDHSYTVHTCLITHCSVTESGIWHIKKISFVTLVI